MINPKKTSVFLIFLAITLVSFSIVGAASAQTTLVKAEASTTQPKVGDTITVTIKIANAQSLFGVDVTLDWNQSVLQLVDAQSQLGVESHSSGVLHESTNYPIEVVDNTSSQSTGTYHLAASSTGSSTPAFSGSGNIAVLTFKVTSTGPTGLALNDVELSVLASDGSGADLVTPQTSVDAVNVAIPEFPMTVLVVVIVVAVSATVIVSTKVVKKR